MPSAPPITILHVFSTFAVGGPQVRFAKIAAHLGDEFHHAILAMDGDYACRSRLDPRVHVSYPEITFRKGHTAANALRFRRCLRELRPDVMVTNNWGSIEWSVANAVPLTRHIHIEDGFGPEERDAQIQRRVWMRRVFLRHSTVVVPSLTLRRIATETWKLPAARVKHIPNGIDCAQFDGRSRMVEPPGNGVVIGTVAALRPEKNISRLLHAFSRVATRRAARLVIVGDGPDLAELRRLAGELGLMAQVEFVGHAERPEEYYGGFDIFALSSDTEQMPLAIIEAMAAGLPIAATDVGDTSAMVADVNRALVTGCDADALANSLQQLVADREKRDRLGAANRKKARRLYDQEEMFGAYSWLFRASEAERATDAWNGRQGTPRHA